MLSPRILHFAHDQIFWDCGTISACEILPSGLPIKLDYVASTDRHWRGRLQESSSLAHAPLSGVNTDSLGGFWSSSVLNYTQCELTSQDDKSRDMMGEPFVSISRAIQNRPLKDYLLTQSRRVSSSGRVNGKKKSRRYHTAPLRSKRTLLQKEANPYPPFQSRLPQPETSARKTNPLLPRMRETENPNS